MLGLGNAGIDCERSDCGLGILLLCGGDQAGCPLERPGLRATLFRGMGWQDVPARVSVLYPRPPCENQIMLLRLIVLFVFVPWLELFILFRLSEVAGFRAALALVLVTGVVGAALARREGIQALTRIRAALKRGEIPGRQMIDGVLILAADDSWRYRLLPAAAHGSRLARRGPR